MEVSRFSTLLAKPSMIRPTFINNGSYCNGRDLSNMPCSCISGFGRIDKPSSQSKKQHILLVTCNLKRDMDVKLLPCPRSFNQQTVNPLLLGQTSRSGLLYRCEVKNEDSEGSESVMLDEQTLERELQIAIKEENYAHAAKLRDSLKLLQEDSKTAVLAANSRFYNSFRNGDLAAMQTLWSKNDNVCVVHPGVSGISGYELVMGSWEFVWADYEFPLNIEVKDVQVHVRGDVGYVTCVEMVRTTGKNWGRQFATNVFEKVDGQWFICVHHASHVDL